MDSERLKVLEILAQGGITAEEAARLLDCLDDDNTRREDDEKATVIASTNQAGSGKKLRVLVNGFLKEEGKINVNVSVPMVLARMADNIIENCVPSAVMMELKDNGIDLKSLNISKIIDTIETLDEDIVNVDLDQGDQSETKLKVRVYVE